MTASSGEEEEIFDHQLFSHAPQRISPAVENEVKEWEGQEMVSLEVQHGGSCMLWKTAVEKQPMDSSMVTEGGKKERQQIPKIGHTKKYVRYLSLFVSWGLLRIDFRGDWFRLVVK